MIRDKTFYGLKPDPLKTPKKSVPWVDVSDDNERDRRGSMKRKISAVNGHSYHAQNGHKLKKHRVNGSVNNDFENQTNGAINGAGPSQTKPIIHHGAGHTPQHAKAKAIQEQRTQLPIAKGSVRLLYLLIYIFEFTDYNRKRCSY